MYSQQAEMKGMKRQMCNVFVQSLNKIKLAAIDDLPLCDKNIQALHDYAAHATRQCCPPVGAPGTAPEMSQ